MHLHNSFAFIQVMFRNEEKIPFLPVFRVIFFSDAAAIDYILMAAFWPKAELICHRPFSHLSTTQIVYLRSKAGLLTC